MPDGAPHNAHDDEALNEALDIAASALAGFVCRHDPPCQCARGQLEQLVLLSNQGQRWIGSSTATIASSQTSSSWTLTVDDSGHFICHGDITADAAADPTWRAVEVVEVYVPEQRHYDTLEIGRHRSKAELIDLLNEAIELAEEGWGYAPEYFRNKWDSEGRLAGLRGVFDHAR